MFGKKKYFRDIYYILFNRRMSVLDLRHPQHFENSLVYNYNLSSEDTAYNYNLSSEDIPFTRHSQDPREISS